LSFLAPLVDNVTGFLGTIPEPNPANFCFFPLPFGLPLFLFPNDDVTAPDPPPIISPVLPFPVKTSPKPTLNGFIFSVNPEPIFPILELNPSPNAGSSTPTS
jgi:hypothetical protein